MMSIDHFEAEDFYKDYPADSTDEKAVALRQALAIIKDVVANPYANGHGYFHFLNENKEAAAKIVMFMGGVNTSNNPCLVLVPQGTPKRNTAVEEQWRSVFEKGGFIRVLILRRKIRRRSRRQAAERARSAGIRKWPAQRSCPASPKKESPNQDQENNARSKQQLTSARPGNCMLENWFFSTAFFLAVNQIS